MAQAMTATSAVFEKQVGERLKLRPVEFTILAMVDEHPGMTGSMLSRALAVAAPNLSNLLAKLEERGLIRKEASEVDRRASYVFATVQGALIARQAAMSIAAGELETLASLSSGERMLLVELLEKVAASRPMPR